MYYRFESDEAVMTTFLTPERECSRSLILGGALRGVESQLPFRYRYRDPTGAPLQDYYPSQCLMSKRLVARLELAGVDNLQRFEVELVDEDTGRVRQDFWCVNILGMVACADLARSNATEFGSSYYFYDLALDARKTHDLRMFRVAESMIDVLVHDSVVDALRGGVVGGIVLTPVRGS